MNEIIADEKDINNDIFLNYFNYQDQLFLVKDLIIAQQNKNKKLVNNINDGLTDLTKGFNRKEIPGNEDLKNQLILLKKPSSLINNKKVGVLKW